MRSKKFHSGWFGALSLLMILAGGCHKGGSGPASPAEIHKEKSELLAWNLKTTVEAYNNAGFTNAAWDEAARACLTEFAHSRAPELNSDEDYREIIATNSAAAVNAGCKDPMVNDLFIGYVTDRSNKGAFADSCYKNSKDMYNSSYPAVRKFYAFAGALDQLYSLRETNNDPRLEEILRNLYTIVPEALSDKTMPPKEAGELAGLILYLTSGDARNEETFYQMIEQQMSKNWPDSYVTWYEKGNYHIDAAWSARGSGLAKTVTPEGWRDFSNNLVTAQQSFEHAWKLDSQKPEIAEQMMTVVLGQGGDFKRLDLWFNRAMQLNTNNYDACQRKLNYLEPKWYGSSEDQLAFGHECAESKKWGGRVPLILVDAHIAINSRNEESQQADYWKQFEVWRDIQSAYDRFFELNPDATDYYHNYAWYAYHAEAWDKLNELIPKLGRINYDFFGGKDEYDKMVRLAKEHAK